MLTARQRDEFCRAATLIRCLPLLRFDVAFAATPFTRYAYADAFHAAALRVTPRCHLRRVA